MNNSLYTITQDYLAAFEALEIDPETGEVTNAELLETLGGEFDEKVESVAMYIKNLEAFAAQISVEEKKLAERRKYIERKSERLSEYLARCLEMAGRDRFDTARAALSFRRSASVTIENADVLPMDFIKETITYSPDKSAIKRALQSGVPVRGATLVEKRHLQIK